MPYIKVIKTRSYFKRYQVKFRRRREGKTDYYARKRLIIQDKTKYNTPKYRLVVRKTNKDIICQIAYATIKSDRVLADAYSHELPRYGVKVGLKNYSAAYATGLLIARRVLAKLELDKTYPGLAKAEGKYFAVEEVDGERRPFYVLLDVGLNRTSTGAKIFAALKGAADGGLDIPHGKEMKPFPGYNKKNGKFDPKILRKYIFGGHVGDYMKKLKESDPEAYQRQFGDYIKAGVEPEKMEAMWTACHAAIRKNPAQVKKERPEGAEFPPRPKKKQRTNLKQRKNRVKQIKANLEKVAKVD